MTEDAGRKDRSAISRRKFLEMTTAGTAAGASLLVNASERTPAVATGSGANLIWGYLIHLGFNFWFDRDVPQWRDWSAKDYIRCDLPLWHELVDRMEIAGINMAVIDLGEGIQYKSHPELAVKGSWSRSQLRDELQRMREKGIEPIPKLNFSAMHDTWLGVYHRCVSSKIYYEVCSDLIAEVIELFDTPRLLHLGLDEEAEANQRNHNHATIRQFELKWNDLAFLAHEVEKGGVRPWVWADYANEHPQEYFANVAKSILQSSWYYKSTFATDEKTLQAINQLDVHGYDQLITCSNYSTPDNFEKSVSFYPARLSPSQLLGFIQTTWFPTLTNVRWRHYSAIDQVARGRQIWLDGRV
ncbi:MAG: twin-arginine translocation signal domain-containing protein [Xanthomonadales bacterium]|nr:twin-arginine translocation signal domain-containing protein [Xanthomonadales bacterium]